MQIVSFNEYIPEDFQYLKESASDDVANDDKGKLHELLLAKHLHPKKELPKHHRAESDNEEHSGTPQQVHDRLRKKIGEHAYKQIDSHAKQTAKAVHKHLEDNGHTGSNGHSIHTVHWTSNRDTAKKAGDHEKTTGVRDVNSNADLIITTKHKSGKGKPNHIGVSAKYGKGAKPNYRNDGLDALGKKAGHKAGHYEKHWADHVKRTEALGYKGTQSERHAMHKKDKAIHDAEMKDHLASGKTKDTFKPKSKEAKRMRAAEASSLQARTAMAKSHAAALKKKVKEAGSDKPLRDYHSGQVSAPTHFHHVIAHSHTQKDGSAVSKVHDADHVASDALRDHKDLDVKQTGMSVTISGTHKKTGKRRVLGTQTFKQGSGPHKGANGTYTA